LGLLKIIRELIFKSDDRQYKYKAKDQVKRAYHNLRQTPEMSCQEYFEKVRNLVDVIRGLEEAYVMVCTLLMSYHHDLEGDIPRHIIVSRGKPS
jgi:hypothetical protein